MNHRIHFLLALATLLAAGGVEISVYAQQSPATSGANEAERQRILHSDRWRRAEHGLEQWLSVQQLYSPQEVAMLRAQFKSRIARMSPAELEQQLTRVEEKLAVLSSPEAEDARRWLAQFLAVQAKYTDAQLRQMRPDVANMTASQIRAELARFQERRGQTQQTQSAAQQGRALQIQSAQTIQDSRRQAQEAARQSAAQAASTAATFAPPTQRTIDPVGPIPLGPPMYTVGPWGTPLRWDPRVDFW